MAHKVTELTSLHISLDDDNAVVVLQRGSDKSTVSVETESTRVHAASGGRLDVGEFAVLADLVGNQRVGRDLALAVEGGDGEGCFVAGGGDDEFAVGLVTPVS